MLDSSSVAWEHCTERVSTLGRDKWSHPTIGIGSEPRFHFGYAKDREFEFVAADGRRLATRTAEKAIRSDVIRSLRSTDAFDLRRIALDSDWKADLPNSVSVRIVVFLALGLLPAVLRLHLNRFRYSTCNAKGH